MSNPMLTFRVALLAITLAPFSSMAAEPFAWQTDAPENHGLSAAKLDALRDHLAAHSTKAFLLVRDDRIVYEWYSADHSATTPHGTASMAKALVGGVAVAVALSDGRLALDDPASRFIPQWRADPVKSRITFRQLMADGEAGIVSARYIASARETSKRSSVLAGAAATYSWPPAPRRPE